jgi:dTDP-4-dehydrorhamnose 3,5-epimerase
MDPSRLGLIHDHDAPARGGAVQRDVPERATAAGGNGKAVEGPGPSTALIDGVVVVPLRRIPDERGTIFHMLRRTDPHFEEFGEIYFTSIYRDVVKGWHRHSGVTLNYACVWGRIKLVLYDDRRGSPTRGVLMEQFLGPDDYSLVVIPPLVWNGMKGMTEVAIVADLMTRPHDPTRTERLSPWSPTIPYDWDIHHR